MSNNSAVAKVLVVEDSHIQARMMQITLEKAGYEVEILSNAESALESLKCNSFDLVVSDVMMPGMSGYELCQRIKSQDDIKTVPVVLVTALNELQDLVEGLKVGADNFITKPFEPGDLLNRISTVLSTDQPASGQKCDPTTGTCSMSQKFLMNLDRKRILDYLVSTFDDYFRSRQRENEMRSRESRRRLLDVEQKEQFLANLTNDLAHPVAKIEEELALLASGQYGCLTPRQLEVIVQLHQEGKQVSGTFDNLVGNYTAVSHRSVA